MKPRRPEERPEEGRPVGSVEALLYNRPADTLVAVMVHGFNPGPPLRRLYARRLPGTAYRPLPVRHALESQQDPCSCEGAPMLIFNEFRFRDPRPTPDLVRVALRGREPPREPWGADWVGVRRYNLETGEDLRVLDEETLRPPPPYSRGWVSYILNVSADASKAVCTLGLTPGHGVDYCVCEVSLVDGRCRMIAKLPDVFL